MRVLEVCAGGGGLALGTERAGLEHAAMVELDADACGTLLHNRPHWPVHRVDLRLFEPTGPFEILTGAPPCQPFSESGKRQAGSDSRDLLDEFTRLALDHRPRVAVLENVPGLRLVYARERFRETCSALARAYRHVAVHQLNAADYGVPQRRLRLFVVAADRWFPPPPPTHGDPALLGLHGGILQPWATARQALGLGPDWGAMRRGHGYVDHDDWMDLDAPATTVRTILTDYQLVRPAAVAELRGMLSRGGPRRRGERYPGTRLLTVHEMALLQGFPADWVFCGAALSRGRQAGNATPPALAEAVMRGVVRLLEA